jgi:5'-nucleotidase / UDP-sugar diphosphatase
MKKLTIILVLIFLVSVRTQTDTITILHINDTHSTLAPLAPRDAALHGTRGGIARATTIIGTTKAQETNVLKLHGGDLFIGDLFFNKYFGVAELQIMKQLGFDAMCVGNHEFDLGPATLQAALDNAFVGGGFPLLSANMNMDNFPTLKQYIKKYIIKQVGNVKVGIFGLTTPETNSFSLPYPVVIDSFENAAVTSVTELRQQGCNLVICLSHLGILYDQGLAASLPGIDVIISAHDHLATPNVITVGSTHIVQTDAFYSQIGKMKLIVTGNNVSLLNYQLITLDQNVPEEPQTKALIDTLIAGIEATYGPVYSQQIGTATEDIEELAGSLTVPGDHDTPLGNLLTDAYRWKTGTQIALLVGGSTAQPIYKGSIVAADAFRAIGYGFDTVKGLGYRLIKFKLTGLDILKGLEFGLSSVEYNDELLPQVSGMKYTYNPAKPQGNRVTSVTIGNQPIDSIQLYTVTCNEFLSYALAQMVGVQPFDPYLYVDSTEFEVLTQYIISQQTISPIREGRVKFDPKLGTDREKIQPLSYTLEQNYPNPFNPATTLKFTIPVAAKVSLQIFDITGKLVRTLLDEYKQAGSYSVSFDARDYSGRQLSSGVYFYRLHAADQVITRKCVLLK